MTVQVLVGAAVILPPDKVKVLAGEPDNVTLPPHWPGAAETKVKPVGRVSEKATFVSVAAVGLVRVKVRLVVLPATMEVAAKVLLIVGLPTEKVADAPGAGAEPALVVVIEPILLE